jgi:hypothetical protein
LNGWLRLWGGFDNLAEKRIFVISTIHELLNHNLWMLSKYSQKAIIDWTMKEWADLND